DVSRLLAAERGSYADHLLEHVLVADWRTQHADAFSCKRCFQTEIRHYGRNDHVSGQATRCLQRTGRNQQDAVAINDFSAAGNEYGAVGIPIESHAKISSPL